MTDYSKLDALGGFTPLAICRDAEARARRRMRIELENALRHLDQMEAEQAEWPALVAQRGALLSLADAGKWAEKVAEAMLPRTRALAPPVPGRWPDKDGDLEKREQFLETQGFSS